MGLGTPGGGSSASSSRPATVVARPSVGRPGVPRSHFIQGLRSTDLAPPTSYSSGPSTLAVTYPMVIDTPPDLQDGKSPAVAMWINLLQQMVEAIQAEIGPFPTYDDGSGVPKVGLRRPNMPHGPGIPNETIVTSLKALLGQQTSQPGAGSGNSRAALCSSISGNGKPAGTLYGVQSIDVTRTDWTGEYTSTITNPFGFPVAIKLPIAWGYGLRPITMSGQVFGDSYLGRIAAIVDSQATGSPSTSVNYSVRYCASTARSPGTGGSFIPVVSAAPGLTARICIIYMMTEDDA